MQIIAAERGGKCLSQKYVNNKTKLLWECAKGHQWEAQPTNVKQGQWCPDCAGVKRLTLKDMQMLARKRGGKCLSQEYINANSKLLWECGKGHQWKAKPNNIKSQGQWCPECSGKKKLTLKEMQTIARKRGGKCLAEEYGNSYTKLLWECKEGHRWRTNPHNIKRGSWCPKCSFLRRANQQKLKSVGVVVREKLPSPSQAKQDNKTYLLEKMEKVSKKIGEKGKGVNLSQELINMRYEQ